MKKFIYIKLLPLCLLVLLAACDIFENNKLNIPEESEKNIAGSWKILKAVRNEVDITTLMDFSKFRLKFKADNTYTITDYLPFAVREDGTWSLDNPQYPFYLTLNENNAPEALVLDFNYPVLNGKRIISLSFSPGCHSNVYTYIFEKETSEN